LNGNEQVYFNNVGDKTIVPLKDLFFKTGHYSSSYFPTTKLKNISSRINILLGQHPEAVIHLRFRIANELSSNKLVFFQFIQEIYFLREFLMTYDKKEGDSSRNIALHPSVMSYIHQNDEINEHPETYLVLSIATFNYFIKDEKGRILDVSDYVKEKRVDYEFEYDSLIDSTYLPKVKVSQVEANGNGQNVYIIEASRKDGSYATIKLECDFIISIDFKYEQKEAYSYLDICFSEWCMSSGFTRLRLPGK
jgi:hypothetical protein